MIWNSVNELTTDWLTKCNKNRQRQNQVVKVRWVRPWPDRIRPSRWEQTQRSSKWPSFPSPHSTQKCPINWPQSTSSALWDKPRRIRSTGSRTNSPRFQCSKAIPPTVPALNTFSSAIWPVLQRQNRPNPQWSEWCSNILNRTTNQSKQSEPHHKPK